MAAPPSQKYRQIGFVLESPMQATQRFTFAIRPEELTRPEPGRLTPQQTLGGAWADAFGRGISTITLSGHNGWRGGFLSSGEDLFQQLRSIAYQGWYDQRALTMAAGQDPNGVKLYFTDSLDQISAVVAPQSFTLRRSKTSPLLLRYHMQLVILDDAAGATDLVDEIINALSDPLRWLAGVTGLGNVVAQINNFATQASNLIGAIGAAGSQFVDTGLGLIQSVQTTAQSLQGQFDESSSALLNAGRLYATAGANAWQALAADPTLSSQERIPVMALASNFNDAACTMANAFDIGRYYIDYSSIFGASTCSSTAGGDPPSAFTINLENPFAAMTPAAQAPVSITPAAQAALVSLSGDPLFLVGQTAAIGQMMGAAAAGVTVS